jgi:two-component system chemotaxis response regulator CheB
MRIMHNKNQHIELGETMTFAQMAGMEKIRVLIVDDSVSTRMLIRRVLSTDPIFEVIGAAGDGIEAIGMVLSLKPDVVTLDVEMPRMDGITALRLIMTKAPATRVIMLSNLTHHGAKTTLDALDAGAFSFVLKSTSNGFKDEIVSKVKEAAYSGRGSVFSAPLLQSRVPVQSLSVDILKGKKINSIGIGASTGGPLALQEILAQIPATFPHGIFVVIHMPKAFTNAFAERLNSKSALTVKEAANGDLLRPGVALIAPGGKHATLVRHGSGIMVRIHPAATYPQHVNIPSVDLMLSSLAESSGGASVGVILTGMGNDGFKGMQHLKLKGGVTIAQDEESSTIYSMPKACIDGGVADIVLPLNQIGSRIAEAYGV